MQMGEVSTPPDEPHSMIRARLLRRLGNVDETADGKSLRAQVQAAVDDIRNGLVPLQTIATLLDGSLDEKTQKWCSTILRSEIKRLLRILREVSAAR